MMTARFALVCMLLVATSLAAAADGLIAIKSPHSVKITLDRFEAAAKGKGLNIFLRLDHSAGAEKIGKELRPTELLIFGNPQGGTPLMLCTSARRTAELGAPYGPGLATLGLDPARLSEAVSPNSTYPGK